MRWTGQFFSRLALDLLSFPISTANVERAFSGLRFVNRKKRAAITNCNVANYSCIYTTTNYKYNRRYIFALVSLFLNSVCVKQKQKMLM